jgi:hypothetical protein
LRCTLRLRGGVWRDAQHDEIQRRVELQARRGRASQKGPVEEFAVSVHLESEGWFLDFMRHQATNISEQTIGSRIMKLLYDDGGRD